MVAITTADTIIPTAAISTADTNHHHLRTTSTEHHPNSSHHHHTTATTSRLPHLYSHTTSPSSHTSHHHHDSRIVVVIILRRDTGAFGFAVNNPNGCLFLRLTAAAEAFRYAFNSPCDTRADLASQASPSCAETCETVGYNPPQMIMIVGTTESRDAIFDESRCSSIPRPKDIIQNSDEFQRDDHSNDVTSETPEPRKGKRARKAKSYGSDCQLYLVKGSRYQIGSQYSYCYSIEEDPRNYNEATQSRDAAFWKEAIDDEIDMGEADVILGIKIKRENKRIVITQSHNIKKILKKFNREDCSSVSTPMDLVKKLKPNTCKPVDQLEYSRAIGCLMYAMTSTRPDIAYAVGRLSRFTSNPSRQHWHVITRIHLLLVDGCSAWGSAISWAFKKQTCITGSTIKSEFVALSVAGKEAEWKRNLIHEILIWPKPITPISIHCDSASTLAKAYSQIYNGKSRHLGVRQSMIRELIMNGVISMSLFGHNII
uniref:Zinc finger, CCHC-type n=1 Tax=Tanacetum cinerariifolium TaxID=118510 RepID=A0A6L2M1E5_TANCI|nr:hypothetical protein [Tanacetum cinerariifolium]